MEEYFAKDVETELGLSQTKLIRLAMLLGSDYTEGVNGIGESEGIPIDISLTVHQLTCTAVLPGTHSHSV